MKCFLVKMCTTGFKHIRIIGNALNVEITEKWTQVSPDDRFIACTVSLLTADIRQIVVGQLTEFFNCG